MYPTQPAIRYTLGHSQTYLLSMSIYTPGYVHTISLILTFTPITTFTHILTPLHRVVSICTQRHMITHMLSLTLAHMHSLILTSILPFIPMVGAHEHTSRQLRLDICLPHHDHDHRQACSDTDLHSHFTSVTSQLRANTSDSTSQIHTHTHCSDPCSHSLLRHTHTHS